MPQHLVELLLLLLLLPLPPPPPREVNDSASRFSLHCLIGR
jgi:hypothetical protein